MSSSNAQNKGSAATFSLVEALSFHRENEPEGEQRKKLLKTLDLLNEMSSDENSSSDEQHSSHSGVHKQMNKSSAKGEMLFDLQTLRRERPLICKVSIFSSQSFKAPSANCLASGIGHYFGFFPSAAGDSQCEARFRQALEWLCSSIAEGSFKERIYIYAVHLQVLFVASPAKNGEISVYLPKSILSLRKFLVRIVGQDLAGCNCSSADQDNTLESAIEFNCKPSVLLSIAASFGELSHRDGVMQIYASLPFPFATVMPNVVGGVKRFVKIVQLCNNEITGERIVQEQHTFSLGIEGVFFGNAVIEYLCALSGQDFVVEMQCFSWSCCGEGKRRMICRDGCFYLDQF